MDALTYQHIAANVAAVQVDGPGVQVTWKCPATGKVVGQSVGYMAPDPALASKVQASVRRSVVYEVIYGLARFIVGLVPGAAGRVISTATYTVAGELSNRATAAADYTDASREAAIVGAFAAVQASFTWDEGRRQFVAR